MNTTCCKHIFNLCNPMPACIDVLTIVTPIVSSNIIIYLHDKFNNSYKVDNKATDIDGKTELILHEYIVGFTPDLPESLLNQFAGNFRISIFDVTSSTYSQWTIDGLQYDSIGIKIESVLPALSIVRPITFEINPFTMEGIQGSYNL